MPDCPRCGTPIPPSKERGNPRKWCSNRCSLLAAKARYRASAKGKATERKYATAYNARRYAEHGESMREAMRLRKYGLTADELVRMRAEQRGRCKICRVEFGSEGAVKEHVDHCHRTGKVRGLLCAPCNWALGNVRDNVETLRAMINYLESSLANG